MIKKYNNARQQKPRFGYKLHHREKWGCGENRWSLSVVNFETNPFGNYMLKLIVETLE